MDFVCASCRLAPLLNHLPAPSFPHPLLPTRLQFSFMGSPSVPRRLQTGGVYALLRHPQALGNMMFLIGGLVHPRGAPGHGLLAAQRRAGLVHGVWFVQSAQGQARACGRSPVAQAQYTTLPAHQPHCLSAHPHSPPTCPLQASPSLAARWGPAWCSASPLLSTSQQVRKIAGCSFTNAELLSRSAERSWPCNLCIACAARQLLQGITVLTPSICVPRWLQWCQQRSAC